jgi:hypothetical protein
MTYRVIKVIKGISYLYEQESYREGGKVKTRCRCLGRVDAVGTVNTTSKEHNQNMADTADTPDRAAIHAALTSEGFRAFFQGETTAHAFPVAVLPDKAARLIGTQASIVRISSETAKKQRAHHPEIQADEYTEIQQVIDEGEFVQQDEKRLAFFRRLHRWYVVVLKSTRDGRELYLLSFFRANDRTVRQIRERGHR